MIITTSLSMIKRGFICIYTDNPSYFTVTGSNSGGGVAIPEATGSAGGGVNKSKRFKNWFKIKRPFRSSKLTPEEDSGDAPPEELPLPDFFPPSDDVVYYNFTGRQFQDAADAGDAEDDVFSDTSTVREVTGSTRTLNRRRHSIGSWFRSSLAAVRKNATTGSSTASGLEATGTGSGTAMERPSTSSERALLARAVSSSVNCVSYR